MQRWLQISKHLPGNGWTPIIYTAKDAKYPIFDQKLEEQVPKDIEVHKVRVPEPNNIISLFQKNGKGSSSTYKLQQQSNLDKSVFKKMLWTIRGNIFIPDARMFWIGKSFRYLDAYLKENPVDAIISTGPPHSTHLIAHRIKEKHGIPWISDFRDPWTSMDYLKKMNLSKLALKKHQRLEESVLRNSTNVIVVGKTIQKEFKENYCIDSTIIYNGFNDLEETPVSSILDEKFTIVHTGSFLHYRNCIDLWSSLSELVSQNRRFAKDLEIKLVGNVAPIVLQTLEAYNLTEYLNLISHVEHAAAKTIQRSAQLLLLPIDRIENAEFVITGKVFEYLKAKRPILLIGPSHGDAAELIRSCQAGEVVDFDDVDLMKEVIKDKYNKYQKKSNLSNSKNIDQFSYANLTKKVTEILEDSIL